MKMRVLTASSKGKMLSIGNIVAGKYGCGIDKIPPAYSCEREKLVVVVASLKSSLPNDFVLFCKDLSKDRAQNVAFIVDGTEENFKKVSEMITAAGANVIDDVLYVKGGLPFGFIKGVPDAEKAAVEAWIEKIVGTVFQSQK